MKGGQKGRHEKGVGGAGVFPIYHKTTCSGRGSPIYCNLHRRGVQSLLQYYRLERRWKVKILFQLYIMQKVTITNFLMYSNSVKSHYYIFFYVDQCIVIWRKKSAHIRFWRTTQIIIILHRSSKFITILLRGKGKVSWDPKFVLHNIWTAP